MKKRVLSVLVTLTMICSIISVVPVYADTGITSGECGYDVSWILDSSGTLTISGTGKMDDYDISLLSSSPFAMRDEIINVIIGDEVTYIGSYAFTGCKNLESITILPGVEKIGHWAFFNNPNLTSVSIPETVTEIGAGVFSNCEALGNITLHDNIEKIGDCAFQRTNISSIVIPQGIERIEYATFAYCGNLKTISIPTSVATFGLNAFLDCDNLTDVYYEGSDEDWNRISNNADVITYSTGNPSYGDYGNGDIRNAYLHYKGYIKVLLNGQSISFSHPPIVKDGRTLVPLRAIFEAMGATVDWDGNTQTVTSTLEGTTVKLTIGSNILYRNGEAKTLDVPAQIINGYTMVPARAVAEAFGAKVDWDGATQTVYITTTGNSYTVYTVPEIVCDGFDANFANFNGLYIDSFTHYTNADGSENVKFDAYNTNYIYGVVEVFDGSGNLSDVAIIDKVSSSTSIKGVLIDDTGSLIRDIFTGTALTYRQESNYSKKTAVSIDIPKGGYIKITTDMNESLIASLINLSDMVLSAKKTFSTLNGFNSDTSKEYVQELSAKLIKDVAFAEILNNPTKYSDDLWKGVGNELYMNSESIGGFIGTVSKNLDELADGKFTDLMLSTAGNCGISIAESTFESLAGPIGVALKAIFTISSVSDCLMEMNDGLNCMYNGSIKIHTAK